MRYLRLPAPAVLAPASAWADHGGAASRSADPGAGLVIGVLVVGLLVVVALAAWAFLAPERPDGIDGDRTGPDR